MCVFLMVCAGQGGDAFRGSDHTKDGDGGREVDCAVQTGRGETVITLRTSNTPSELLPDLS